MVYWPTELNFLLPSSSVPVGSVAFRMAAVPSNERMGLVGFEQNEQNRHLVTFVALG